MATTNAEDTFLSCETLAFSIFLILFIFLATLKQALEMMSIVQTPPCSSGEDILSEILDIFDMGDTEL